MVNDESLDQLSSEQIFPTEMPSWRNGQTGIPLTEFGIRPNIIVAQGEDFINVPEKDQTLLQELRHLETPTFFDGPYATVTKIKQEGDCLNISAAKTSSFNYIVSSYTNRDDQGHNPIIPLAVQSTVFTPNHDRIIWEVRDSNLTDWPGAITVAGGAVKPEETTDLRKTMAGKLRDKYGITTLEDEQVNASGVTFETVNGIVCITYSLVLTPDQYQAARESHETAKAQGKARKLVLINPNSDSIENMFLNKRTLDQWDPNGFFNVLYALAAEGLRTPEQIQELLSKEKELLNTKADKGQIQYTYPIERYLKLNGK